MRDRDMAWSRAVNVARSNKTTSKSRQLGATPFDAKFRALPTLGRWVPERPVRVPVIGVFIDCAMTWH